MNARPCNARRTGGVERCVENWRHDKGPKPTKHSDGEGCTWGEEWAEAPVARSRIKTGQPDQWGTVEQAYRDGRKEERIDRMIATHGHAYCESAALDLGTCVVRFDSSGSAKSGLDFAHLTRRSQAQGYRPGKGGGNDRLFALLCRSHHGEYDGSVLRFSERAS